MLDAFNTHLMISSFEPVCGEVAYLELFSPFLACFPRECLLLC